MIYAQNGTAAGFELVIVAVLLQFLLGENGNIEGIFILNQYAVTGEGRELAPAVIPTVPHGVDNVFGTPGYELEEDNE